MIHTSQRPPIPDQVREAVLRRADGSCEDCGCQRPLEMHHLTYQHPETHLYPADDWVHPNIFGHERPEDLAALCRGCHRGRHVDINGDFWADPEEKADHWWGFYNELDKD